MKFRFYLFALACTVLFFQKVNVAFAGPGDTTVVQTFTFGSNLDGWFPFPDSTKSYEKILMYYTLKCNPNQNPACGEWDYLTYTYLYQHTGKLDSTLYYHSNFEYNGTTPDSLMLMNQPSWKYIPYFEYFNQTTPLATAMLGNGTLTSSHPFSAQGADARSQYLWKASELSAAGLTAGQITGLRLNFTALGGDICKLHIRLKNSSLDSLSSNVFENDNFTEVYLRNTSFNATGWQTMPFTYPFVWDGVSNVVADISFEDHDTMNPMVTADNTSFASAVTSNQTDNFLDFEDNDFVEVPANTFATIDSAITISFWQYGDPLLQPENCTAFEGIDSVGHRVLNVHLPWGDSKVYWDAGCDSTGKYDRIFKVANDPSVFRGKWNYWTFTKDVAHRRMRIYLNGNIFFVGGGKSLPMKGIEKFRIGSNGSGSDNFYDGMIDEFSVWNVALEDTSIQKFMYQDIDSSYPLYDHLVVYYKFNENQGHTTQDFSNGNHTATLVGFPQWKNNQGKNRFRNMEAENVRPAVIFEQGVYNPAVLDSVFMIDTVAKPEAMVVVFGDTIHSYLPTDTLVKWPHYYNNYVYDANGTAIDSTLVTPDTILYRHDYPYYGEPFEVINRYELARYITPYGIGLSLGDGFTWVFDVTDYAPLLRDSVHLTAGNWQELLDMKFIMIEGTPPRKVLGIKNIYTGQHGYDKPESHNLPSVNEFIGQDEKNARLKMRITGHGFGGNLNCLEFCPRTNKLYLNGNLAYTHYVWRNDCGLNPVYPQGGTWVYDRAEWCPGAEVRTTDFELTPFMTPGDTLTIDYDLEEGYIWNGEGSWPYYAIESQLVTYDQPNFNLDAALEEIVAPNSHEFYNRFNPVCGQPIIVIKNNGTTPLTSLNINYGLVGGTMQTYHWTGNLNFLDKEKITLDPVNWAGWQGGNNHFIFTLSNPNNGADEYSYNNSMTAPFEIPPTYDNMLIFKIKTNHASEETSWKLEDNEGNILYQNGMLANNTEYTDTLTLATGCYRLTILDSGGDGLRFWANMPPYGNGTAGWAKINDMEGQIVKTFQADFGSMIAQSFTVGMSINVEENNRLGYLHVYPNPTKGQFNIALSLPEKQDVQIKIYDVFGKEVMRLLKKDIDNMVIPLTLERKTSEIYFVQVITSKGTITQKLLLEK